MSHAVRFLPERRVWRGRQAVPLGVAAAECGILLEQPCGGKGICGRCRVRIPGAPPDSADRRALGAADVDAGWRLGCRVTVRGELAVEVPAGARTTAAKSFGSAGPLPPPIAPLHRGGGWGVALDVGSTTLGAALVDLGTGAVTASATALNPQSHYGADVLSRVALARERADGATTLRRAVTAALDALTGSCLDAAGVPRPAVVDVVAVGNPAMMHFLLGLDARGLGVAPYRGTLYDAWHGRAEALGLELSAAAAFVPPGVDRHVGADAVAGAVAVGLDRPGPARLLLDLGTNTEVLLAAGDRLLCASASAGPAFEGATIHHGMRAVPGAIDRVEADPDGGLRVGTVGGEPAVGVCGSGLVDAVAALLRTGLVEPSGRVITGEAVGPLIGDRIVESPDGGRAVRLAGSAERSVLLTARDVRELQLVKGSIAAAVALLLDEAGLTVGDIVEVLVTGAFGGSLDVERAREIGLVPDLPAGRVRNVGNAAGLGARLALVDRDVRSRMETAAARATFVELADRPDYQAAFVEALPFPVPAPDRAHREREHRHG